MPRASWRGFLRLSLVSCPVYLSPATTRTKPIRLHQVWQPAPVDVDEDDLPDLGGSAPSVTRLRADNAGADGDESPAATRITLRPHDPGTGEEIEKREVVKGYEYRWHQLFSLFRLLTLIFEAARRVHRLWRLGRRFLQCRRALAHVFEMTLARHRRRGDRSSPRRAHRPGLVRIPQPYG